MVKKKNGYTRNRADGILLQHAGSYWLPSPDVVDINMEAEK